MLHVHPRSPPFAAGSRPRFTRVQSEREVICLVHAAIRCPLQVLSRTECIVVLLIHLQLSPYNSKWTRWPDVLPEATTTMQCAPSRPTSHARYTATHHRWSVVDHSVNSCSRTQISYRSACAILASTTSPASNTGKCSISTRHISPCARRRLGSGTWLTSRHRPASGHALHLS